MLESVLSVTSYLLNTFHCSYVGESKARAIIELLPDTYAKRIARYKERYRYHPPSPYKNNSERDSICGTAPTYDKYFSNDAKIRSANDEDKTLYNLFFNNDLARRGTIVELGAYNGIQESNSRFYDLCLGWDSLLIEGMGKTFDLLIQNRPEVRFLPMPEVLILCWFEIYTLVY